MKRDCFIMYSKRLIHIIYHKEKKCSFYYSKYLLIMKNCLMNDNIYIKFPWPDIKWRKKLLHLSTTNPIWKRICMHKYKIYGMKRDCLITYSKRLIHVIYHKEKNIKIRFGKKGWCRPHAILTMNAAFPGASWIQREWRVSLLALKYRSKLWSFPSIPYLSIHERKKYVETREILRGICHGCWERVIR